MKEPIKKLMVSYPILIIFRTHGYIPKLGFLFFENYGYKS